MLCTLIISASVGYSQSLPDFQVGGTVKIGDVFLTKDLAKTDYTFEVKRLDKTDFSSKKNFKM